MRTETIKVTKEDISQGMPACNDGCPLALAMQRVIGPHVSVGTEHFWPYEVRDWYDERVIGDLPDKAQQFVRDFDDGFEVKPIEFTVTFEEEHHDSDNGSA